MIRRDLPKRCACGACHDERAWTKLPLAGIGRDDVEALEYRNCTCGSTLAVVLEGALTLSEREVGRLELLLELETALRRAGVAGVTLERQGRAGWQARWRTRDGGTGISSGATAGDALIGAACSAMPLIEQLRGSLAARTNSNVVALSAARGRRRTGSRPTRGPEVA